MKRPYLGAAALGIAVLTVTGLVVGAGERRKMSPEFRKQFIKDFTRLSHKRPALHVLMITRSLSNEHDCSVLRTLSYHNMSPGFVQITFCTGCNERGDFLHLILFVHDGRYTMELYMS